MKEIDCWYDCTTWLFSTASVSVSIWLKTDKVHAFRRKKYQGFFLGKLSYTIMKTVACTGFWLLAFMFWQKSQFLFSTSWRFCATYMKPPDKLNNCILLYFTSKVRNYISNIFQLWTNVHSFQQQCFFWWSSISSDTYVVCSNCLPCISFAQKTWQRLRNIDILHDAIPHPHDRVGHPMHVKVRIWHFFRWL